MVPNDMNGNQRRWAQSSPGGLEVVGCYSHDTTTILRNILESWQPIVQTIQMIYTGVDKIEEKLEAHEADLDALDISNQAATTFVARPNLAIISQQNGVRSRQRSVRD